jgi:hypothetical protein
MLGLQRGSSLLFRRILEAGQKYLYDYWRNYLQKMSTFFGYGDKK